MLRAITQQRRSLFSSSRVSKHFVVIARDFDDVNALERRLAVRDEHLHRILPKVDQGRVLCGGGLLDSHESGKMLGSCLIVDAESKEQVQQLLESDPYVKGKVWKDWDIYPFRCAVGKVGN